MLSKTKQKLKNQGENKILASQLPTLSEINKLSECADDDQC